MNINKYQRGKVWGSQGWGGSLIKALSSCPCVAVVEAHHTLPIHVGARVRAIENKVRRLKKPAVYGFVSPHTSVKSNMASVKHASIVRSRLAIPASSGQPDVYNGPFLCRPPSCFT